MKKNFFYATALVLGLLLVAMMMTTVQLILLTLSIIRRMRQVGTTT